MAKVVGSYASVTRGVSEQVPQDRHPGQMWEQVNMISDPVVGCARRPGSILKDFKWLAGGTSLDSLRSDIRLYRTFTFFHKSKEYAMLYRADAAAQPNALPAFMCYCKTDSKFIDVVQADPSALAPWVTGGVSALTTVGDYIAIAANKLGPGYSVDDRYANHNMHGVAWVRSGAYSRTYTIRITRKSDGVQYTAAYTTMASSYPYLLNTSDIPAGASDYQKQVNDRVNAYNSAVNKWIGDAQASIQPQNIAEQLRASLQAQGFTNCDRRGGTVIIDNVSFMSCDDGGDGTTFRAVYNALDDVGKLSSIHWNGKPIQIKANNQVDPFYMVFKTDAGDAYGTGKWVEGPAQIIQPGQVFAVGGISADGSKLVIGSTPAALNAYSTDFQVPSFAGSIVGDKNQTGAIPYFFGRRISMMTMFQDRLVIVADGTVFMSRTGDYFNFFRRTMLSVNDDDPIQAYALGAQDDVITRCVTYNKNLFLFGVRNQYTLPGSVAATPMNVTISPVAAERDAIMCQPVVHGNIIFYGSQVVSNGDVPYSGIVNQFQLGLFQDVPETFQISKQLSRYIKGRPIEMATISSPPTLLLRSDSNDNGFYVYTYLDAPGTQAREFDSWSRWEFSGALGVVAGISSFQQKLLSFNVMLDAKVGQAANVFVTCNEYSMDTADRTRPYLDSMRVMGQSSLIGNKLNTSGMWDDAYVAIPATQPEFLINGKMTDWNTFTAQYPAIPASTLWGGFDFESYVVPTPPYVRDSNDKAIVNGRLVINKYTVSFTDSAGCDAGMIDKSGNERHVVSYAGRQVGHSNNLVGRVAISTTNFPVPVGRANIDHKIKLIAKTCLPMTISAIEWVGQFFTSGRRV
ncbi:phage tail protein [Burkholderia vietnamiensis]|uniref:phage nozzle protein n=1 Tax=Burkholderia vietnamiensis TaxID=60552 RepID=UPI00264FB254|nr:phage tail protein [Burkholderia vietnamiensis]MDN8042332.1 phage tail protein [Burkholderia vietnamiensis]HDR9131367.1 phage tail protein [Burkholderia vietnamiensis]